MKNISNQQIELTNIKFPIIDKELKASSVHSMDEIDMWIERDYKLFFDRQEYEKNKIKNSVYDQFTIK